MKFFFRCQAELNSQPTGEERQSCYERAIREAISKGILTNYLTRKGTEVINMFIDEYDYDLDMEVKAEEAREEGIEIGREQGILQKSIEIAENLLKNGDSPEKVAQCIGLPLEKVVELQKSSAPAAI